MGKYEYKTPEGTLYKVSVRKWNKHFGNRGRFKTAECYLHEGQATIQFIPTLTGKVITTLLLPIAIVLHGVVNIREMWQDYLKVLSPKKYGSFSSEAIWKGWADGKQWKKLCDMLEIDDER
tara:strand:- start:73 stop:435 length:363 start_codon:yes stop_codon:yes gene_type:complete